MSKDFELFMEGCDDDCDDDCDSCGCGSGCSCGGHDRETVFITVDDNENLECEILGVLPVTVDGVTRDYIALLPLEDDAVLVYRYQENGDEVSLDNIESDTEFDTVVSAFDGLFEMCEEDEDDDEDWDDEDDDWDDEDEDA